MWTRLFSDWDTTYTPAQITIMGTQLLILIGSMRKEKMVMSLPQSFRLELQNWIDLKSHCLPKLEY